MRNDKFPVGWDEERVQRVLAHYEGQTEDEASDEDARAPYQSDDLTPPAG